MTIKNKQTTLRLPNELLNFMGYYASKKGISLNALMVTILNEYKENHS